MSVPVKMLGFALGLAAVFGLALGLGTLTGPVAQAEGQEAHGEGDSGEADAHGEGEGEEGMEGMGGMSESGSGLPAGGLMVSDRGYTLALTADRSDGGSAVPLAFEIDGPDGEPVTEYETSHDKRLHLIVVRRDLTGFQHVHPVMSADGTWSAEVALTSGQWRVFADFVPAELGENLTLGADLAVPGALLAEPLPAPSTFDEVDGYTVRLDGELVPGEESKVSLSVSRDGQPVTDLQEYLGAFGHLVALRDGDLAYLHVHPEGEPGDGKTPAGPEVVFYAEVPSVGDYRLFLDFQHEGVVRTADLTVHAGQSDH